MIHQQLMRLGFSDKEATVYLTLIKHGKHPISFIAEKAKLNRGTTYQVLHNLLERKLVTMEHEKKAQTFCPLPPTQLLRELEEKQKALLGKQKKASSLAQELKAIAAEYHTRPTFQFFQGVEGVRAAVDDTLLAKDKTIRSYCSSYDMDTFLGYNYWGGEYTKKRIEMGYKVRSIQYREKDQLAKERGDYYENYGPSRRANRDVRYLADHAFPVSLYMYDDKTLIVTSDREGFALIVNSPEFSDMQKRIFDSIFETLDFIEQE